MSLLVWLPMTKDLRQQGLSNMAVTNHNVTIDTNGKLGSCCYFNGNQQWLQFDTVLGDYYNNDWSIACWLKPTDSTRSVIVSEYSSSGASNVGLELTAGRVIRLYWNGSPDIYFNTAGALPINEWTHVVVTKKNREVKIYLNGQWKQTYTNSSDFAARTSASQPRIGDDYRGNSSNSVSYQGYMNDFRMYDHCLSEMEVKQLSQGLILHYPLNHQGFGSENLATCTTPLFNISAGTGNYNYAWICGNGTLTIGKTYTFSAEIEVSDNISDCTIYNYQSSPSTARGPINYHFPADGTRHSWTFTAAATGFIVYSGVAGQAANKTAVLRNIKIEENSSATAYIPRSNEAAYNNGVFNSNIEYDTSGYCNNGTQWAYDTNGEIDYTSDTPKYAVSTYINSDNNTTNTASGTQYIYGNCELTTPQYLTVAFWCKPIAGYGNSTGQGQFSLTNYPIGNDAASDYLVGPMNHRDAIVDVNSSTGTHKTVAISFTANEWHHYVVVYDGRYVRVYKDGVAGATTDMGSTITLGSMKGAVIGFSKAGGVWRSNKSYYSDFRLYATALSPTDVKSLYQNCATIDPDGTIRGQIRS